ncbi:hypothetical protein [Streptomyces sp. NPDC093589]|uniref:hypothetical protein n=1 Tax=Streptomyces sp. NPDC093589 TaxID=3366043 RepID=UPI003828E12C
MARPRLVVPELDAQQWERIENAIAARPDAVLVAGTAMISDQLADPAHTAGVPLIPAPEEIAHSCTCDTDVAHSPCLHSVAVGFLLIDRLRTAPAPLFTLRGRPHQHLKKRLRAQAAADSRPGAPASVPAPAAQPTRRTASPPAAVIPTQPTKPAASIPDPVDLDLTSAQPVLTRPLAPPPEPLPALEAWGALVADAAHRAGSLLDGGTPAPCPDVGSDLARFVALPHGASFRQAAQEHLDLDVLGMGHLTLAYTYGGPGGAAAYLEPLAVDHEVLAHAQADIQPLRPAALASVECEDNRITDQAAGIQLRFGPDGRWYPYRAPYGIWQPVPGPSVHVAQAYRAARTAARPSRRR